MQLLVPLAAAVVLIAVSVILVRSHAGHQGIVPLLKGSAAACVLYALFFLANGFLLAWLVRSCFPRQPRYSSRHGSWPVLSRSPGLPASSSPERPQASA